MTQYGITPTGFVAKTAQIIQADIAANMQAAFGASFDTSAGSAAGQLGFIVASVAGELWEVAEESVTAFDADKVTGAAQDALNALTGTIRLPAKASLVFLTLAGVPGTVVNQGSQAKTASTGAVTFATMTGATIASYAAWAPTIAYAQGARVTNAGRVYVCTIAGTSAGSGGPTTTASAIVDNTVTWRYIGEGTGAVDVLSQATVKGPLVAVSGDVTTIVTPASGWQFVINILDATVGSNTETDEDYRVRREEELAGDGAGTAANIAALLLKLPGVIAAKVFENKTDSTDGNGLPPHSTEALVEGGADQDIVNLLGNEVVTGIVTHGTSSGTFTDSQGVTQTINFTRPTLVNIYVDVTLHYDGTNSGINYAGDAAVKSAIATAGAAYVIDLDVFATKVASVALGVSGVLDVPRSGSLGGVLISTAPTPTSDATISIDNRSLAVFDTSRITVHSSAVTP